MVGTGVNPPAWLDRFLAEAPRMTVPAFLRPLPQARAAAVLVLFGEGPHGPDVLLTQRADTLDKHAGQPAFPGGRIDPQDDGPVAAALREAYEETGVETSGCDVLATLPELHLAYSNYRITPVVAWWREPSEVAPGHPGEVASVARVPIADLADPANRSTVRTPTGHGSPVFEVGGMFVWGFTAMLLDRFLEMGGWAVPWDTGRVVELPPEMLALRR